MTDIQSTKEEIYKILKADERTRNSDMYLYLEYCKTHWIRPLELYKVFEDAEFRKIKGVAPFETVSRARRNLQSEFIELKADNEVERIRKENEENYNDFFGKREYS